MINKHFIVLILFLLPLFSWAQPTSKSIYKKNRDKICIVSYYQNTASDSKIGSFNKIERFRVGILVSPDGLVMVSSDVYPLSLDIISVNGSMLSGKPTDFKVELANGKEYPAVFLGKDDQAKVAFIKIEDKSASYDFPYVSFVATENTGVADSVYILELLPRHYNFEPLFTSHTIASKIESPRRKFLINNYTTALSAGGLALNVYGEAIGVTIEQNINFAFQPPGDFESLHKDYLEIAPSEWFIDLIRNPPQIEATEAAKKAWLGIRMQGLSEELKKYWNIPAKGGVVINQIYPESPAAKARLQVKDVILAVNDSAMLVEKDEETAKLRNTIRTLSPGNTAKFKIFRDGQIIHKNVVLEAAPKSIGLAESFPVPELGFEIRELTQDVLYQDNLPLSTPGVFVHQVDRASPAGIGGLNIGAIIQEVNGKPVKDLESAKEIIQNYLENKLNILMLRVLINGSNRFVFIDQDQ